MKKNQNGRLKKTEFFKIANSRYFFMKISWISRIDWSNEHGCGSTYMAGREAVKKCIFGIFRPSLSLCRTASRPYRVSHIHVLCINQSYYPNDQSMKCSLKIWRIGNFEKLSLFWSAILIFFPSKYVFCFAFSSWKLATN